MKNYTPYFLILYFFSVLSISASNLTIKKDIIIESQTINEITFYSNGNIFSPVIVVEGEAEILWTWDDSTTTNSANPFKEYGSKQLRKNKLKVTPWSAVRRINIGYGGQDGGSSDIELVSNQFVSKVENIALVAPYLKEWCSSYNMITSLDFSNFINLETIECYLSQSLQNITLTNTPKLKRTCFVVNKLNTLDLSNCNNIEEILAGANNMVNLILPEEADNLWYIGSRENSHLANQFIVRDLSKYPNIAHLSFWNSNQKGDFIMPKSNLTKWIWIRAYDNEYSSIDLRGSLQNFRSIGYVDFHNNKLCKVEIASCDQIRTLDLSNNLLTSDNIDHILKDLNEYRNERDYGGEIQKRYANLSNNNPPSELGLTYKKELEAKGWTIDIDLPTDANILTDKVPEIYFDSTNDIIKLHINELSNEGIILKIVNMTGQVVMEKKIFENDTEWSIRQFAGRTFFITLLCDHVYATKKIIKVF